MAAQPPSHCVRGVALEAYTSDPVPFAVLHAVVPPTPGDLPNEVATTLELEPGRTYTSRSVGRSVGAVIVECTLTASYFVCLITGRARQVPSHSTSSACQPDYPDRYDKDSSL